MRIHSIFEVIKDTLYAIAYVKNESVLTTIQENWSNVIWLEQFFDDNKNDLYSGFWGAISIDKAIEQTIEDAQLLLYKLRHATKENIDEIFIPLHDEEFEERDFQQLKAKGYFNKSWLRIYAIYYKNKYYITGGTIKLTLTMQERNHTNKELQIIKNVRDTFKLKDTDNLIVYLDNQK